jgi:anti-sigma factor RsiW
MSLALDDRLPEERREALTRHCEACPTCAAEWAMHRKIQDVLQSMPAASPSASLWPQVRARLNEQEARQTWFEDVERFSRRFVPVAAVLLLALLGLATRNAWERFHRTPDIEWLFASSAPEVSPSAEDGWLWSLDGTQTDDRGEPGSTRNP